MSTVKYSDINPLHNNCIQYINDLNNFIISNGLMMRHSRDDNLMKRVPVTLFPSVLPRQPFDIAVRLQVEFNKLIHNIANSYDFLREALSSVIAVDDFTHRLWQIYEECNRTPANQQVQMILSRSDYMIQQTQEGAYGIKNIEFNTIACGYAGLSQKLTSCHRYIKKFNKTAEEINKAIPINKAVENNAKAMVEAWQIYNTKGAVILFAVLEYEANIYDQKLLEYAINEEMPEIKIIFRTMAQLRKVSLIEGKLILDNDEIAIFYQRCGYDPSHFTCEEDWTVRKTIELSKAIKCPTIGYHLAGTKKVQQCLAEKGVLERFVKDNTTVEHLRSTFVGLYALDDSKDGEANIVMIMSDPKSYILKPQREGGGNNVYGDDIIPFLTEIRGSDERLAWIGMQRITPLTQKNILLNGCKDEFYSPCEIVSELGIYGALIGTSDAIIYNKVCGHLLRSKNIDTDEGGVSGGSSYLDSPWLVD